MSNIRRELAHKTYFGVCKVAYRLSYRMCYTTLPMALARHTPTLPPKVAPSTRDALLAGLGIVRVSAETAFTLETLAYARPTDMACEGTDRYIQLTPRGRAAAANLYVRIAP